MLKLYNTLTRKNEAFRPIRKDRVTIYVCGITPYDTTHLGHAFTYISFDILIRYLKSLGYKVIYAQNITDINDRDNDILKKANELNISWHKLASFWTKKFLNDMKILNWVKPDYYLKASENIESMANFIQALLKKGFAYEKNQSVYLDISKIKDYGKLSRFSKEQMLKTAKECEEDIGNKEKRHVFDITLWRAASPGQPKHIPSFDSPFGKGRPGWHLECSVLSMKALGEQIDIHGGGCDLIYPHHESEIAQSESKTGKKPFANFWVHSATVSFLGKKMSKSLGNIVMVSDLFKKYSANAVRYLLISHQYRQAWEYNEKQLAISQQKINCLLETVKDEKRKTSGHKLPDSNRNAFLSFMNNDLNTPSVLRLLDKWRGEILKEKNKEKRSLLKRDLFECLKTLGFIID